MWGGGKWVVLRGGDWGGEGRGLVLRSSGRWNDSSGLCLL